MMHAAEFHHHLGDANICEHIEEALVRAAEISRGQAA
jgi:hypothetical protein